MSGIKTWLIDNIYILPIVIGILHIGARQEVKRLDKRVDALITLLAQRGIKLLDDPDDFPM